MLKTDIQKLNLLPLDRSLDGLEADVWAKIEVETHLTRTRGIVLMWQASTIALVIICNLALGNIFPKITLSIGELDAFSPRAVPAPSNLLLGDHT